MVFDVVPNVGRNRHPAFVFIALGAVDPASSRFRSAIGFVGVGVRAMCDGTGNRQHFAVAVKVLATQFGHFAETQTAPARQQDKRFEPRIGLVGAELVSDGMQFDGRRDLDAFLRFRIHRAAHIARIAI